MYQCFIDFFEKVLIQYKSKKLQDWFLQKVHENIMHNKTPSSMHDVKILI
jgi:hypothetical protein